MYIGKFLDGFDYGVRLLFEQAGVPQLPSPDCLSHRNLCFVNRGGPADWFQPALPWERYLPALCRNLGCAKDVFYCPASCFAIKDLRPADLVLFGEIPPLESERGIRERFYHGLADFLLCRRSESGGLFLTDPLGCPLIEISEEELTALLQECGGFALTLLHRPEIKPVSKTALRRESASVRDECEQGLRFETCEPRKWGAAETIALRYGLMNYQTQRTRSAEFYGLSPAFFSSLKGIDRIFAARDFASLSAIEDLFWNELCEIGE